MFSCQNCAFLPWTGSAGKSPQSPWTFFFFFFFGFLTRSSLSLDRTTSVVFLKAKQKRKGCVNLVSTLSCGHRVLGKQKIKSKMTTQGAESCCCFVLQTTFKKSCWWCTRWRVQSWFETERRRTFWHFVAKQHRMEQVLPNSLFVPSVRIELSIFQHLPMKKKQQQSIPHRHLFVFFLPAASVIYWCRPSNYFECCTFRRDISLWFLWVFCTEKMFCNLEMYTPVNKQVKSQMRANDQFFCNDSFLVLSTQIRCKKSHNFFFAQMITSWLVCFDRTADTLQALQCIAI